MPKEKDIVTRIVKVPLTERERCPEYSQNFPAMPRLYLELLENKAKVKQDLINKDYIPDPKNPDFEQKYEKPRSIEKRKEIVEPKEENVEINEKPEKRKTETDSSDDSVSVQSEKSKSVSSSEDNFEKGRDDSSSTNSSSTSDLSVRLKHLLSDDESSRENFSKSVDKYSRKESGHNTPYNQFKRSHSKDLIPVPQREGNLLPPTLAELEERGKYQRTDELRDINHVSRLEIDEEDKKREMLFKFEILRKSYRQHAQDEEKIPTFTIHADLKEMTKSYETTVKNLTLDSTVESYKTYLIHGFMLTEFVFGNFLGFDMQGFTQQQMLSMNSYERLLVELGEKSYVPEGSKWPVELRLLFLILMNACFFIVGKMILRKTGANVLNMVKDMGMHSNAQPSGEPQRPKRRMRGPTINPENLPDIDDIERPNSNNSHSDNTQSIPVGNSVSRQARK